MSDDTDETNVSSVCPDTEAGKAENHSDGIRTDRQKWVTGIVVPLMIAMLSAGASWQIAMITAKQTIASETREGVAVFNNVGFRYFGAIYSMFDQNNTSGGRVPLVSDYASWKAYRAIMGDIADDIEWLLRNPAYDEIGSNFFPYLQNLMMKEASGIEREIDRGTLIIMCDTFVEKELWRIPDEEGIASEISDFAKIVCEEVANLAQA